MVAAPAMKKIQDGVMHLARGEQTVSRWQHHAVRQNLANEAAPELDHLDVNRVSDVIIVSGECKEQDEEQHQKPSIFCQTVVANSLQLRRQVIQVSRG